MTNLTSDGAACPTTHALPASDTPGCAICAAHRGRPGHALPADLAARRLVQDQCARSSRAPASSRITRRSTAYTKGWKTSTAYTFARFFWNTFPDHLPKVDRHGDLLRAGRLCFARFEFWGKKMLFSIMVGTLLLPNVVLASPQYLLFRDIGWLDSYLAALGSLGLCDRHLLRLHAGAVPARHSARHGRGGAQIDGCNTLQTLLYIVVPMLDAGD